MVEIILAFGLDLLIGDPPYPWHPVRVIGGWIEKSEAWLRKKIPDVRQAGLIQAASIPLVTFIGVWFLSAVASQAAPFVGQILTIYFLYSAISVKDLAHEAKKVHITLRNQKLKAARKNLARIVGRDTENLDETEVIRGTVETIAESFMDGVVSPLFYAAIGGAPLAMAYKAVNTLDSMVGRRSPRYQKFGFWAAKFDEIANWVPARISWLLIGIGTFFVNGRTSEAWRVGLEQSAGSFSNSVVPEAAMAGALGVELGGTNYYAGAAVKTPKLGYPMRSLDRSDIRAAANIMWASSWAALVSAVVLSFFVKLVFH